MSRVKVVNWLAREGDPVSVGTPLVEVETEKAVFVIDSEVAGVLRRVDVVAGERVAVGVCLGVVADAEEVLASPTARVAAAVDSGSEVAASGEYDVDDYSEALLGF